MKEHLQKDIQKYVAGELNLKEQIAFSEQLADPENAVAEELFQEEWKSQSEAKGLTHRNFKTILHRLLHPNKFA